MLAEKLSSRVLDRRLDLLESIIQAGNVLFGRTEQRELSQEECIAVSANVCFNINVPGLPSFAELAGTGRLEIIQDSGLRRALVALHQTREALATMILIQTTSATGANLASAYPELIQLESYFNEEQEEIKARHRCNLLEMRNNQAFLNDFSINADRYDAYVRDGLAPWSTQFAGTHRLVDDALDIEHVQEITD